jgi:hypothetical protein
MTSLAFRRRSKLRGLAVVPGSTPTLENLVPVLSPIKPSRPSHCKTRQLSDHLYTRGARNRDSGSHFPHTLEPAA